MSEFAGGFHGTAPAFKVYLIGKKKQTLTAVQTIKRKDDAIVDESKVISTAVAKTIPSGHVRLMLSMLSKI